MSRTTRHWIAFAAFAVSGVLVAVVLNFILDHPWQFAAILLFGWTIGTGVSQRGPWPFNATIRTLAGARSRVGVLLRDYGLWGAFVVGMIYTVHLLVNRGGGAALAALTGMYLVDRLLAWSIGYVRRAYARRTSCGPVVEDEPVRVDSSTAAEGGL